jgi:hypothetical protein
MKYFQKSKSSGVVISYLRLEKSLFNCSCSNLSKELIIQLNINRSKLFVQLSVRLSGRVNSYLDL